jgi:DNA-binding Xre family transcriptional regulator
MPVVSLLPTLIGQKQAEENRVLNVATIAAETDIPKQTIYNWLNGDIRRFDADIIEKLCDYFHCDVGDLLTIRSIRQQ